MKNTKTKRLSIFVEALLMTEVLAVTILVFGMIVKLNVLPAKLMLLAGAGMLVLVTIIYLLTRKLMFNFRCVVGSLLAIVYIVGLVFGYNTLRKVNHAVTEVTQVKTEYHQVSLFVRMEDKASSISDLKDYEFGILLKQDREATEQALVKIEQELNITIVPTGYSSPADLAQALVNGQMDVILMNPEYITMLTELGDNGGLTSSIRNLTDYSVAVQRVEPVKQEETSETANLVYDPDNVVTEKNNNTLVLYLTGIDTYGNINVTSRSDVNILVVANLNTHQIAIISTPRDYYVTLPNSGGEYDKLTHAGIYGVDVSVETIESIYDIDIDSYVRVNFSGFEAIVDAIGGVTVNNDIAFTGIHGGYFFDTGEITMNGPEALCYVRERYSFLDADYTRAKHQMMVVQAIVQKCMSKEILNHFTDFLSAIEGQFETNMPYDQISSIVRGQLENGGEWNMVRYNVSGTGETMKCWSLGLYASVQVPDETTIEKAKELIRQVLDGETAVKPE